MNDKKKNRLSKIVFLMNGFLFILGGISLFEEEKWIFGLLQMLAGVFNLCMLPKFKNIKLKTIFNYLVLIMNVVVAASVALDYFLSGKKFIQYVWILAAIFSIVALVVEIRKKKTVLVKS